TAAKTKDALGLQVAVNLLNSALENEGATIDGTANTSSSRASFAGLSKLIGEMKNGQVDVLITYRANIGYALPRGALGIADAVAKVPLVISIAEMENETGLMADYVLPDNHY